MSRFLEKTPTLKAGVVGLGEEECSSLVQQSIYLPLFAVTFRGVKDASSMFRGV